MTPEMQEGFIAEYEREPEPIRSIKFTQYLMPDGREIPIWFYPNEAVPLEIFDMADTLILNGASFEAEMLTTGEISLKCVLNEEVDPSLGMVVCDNGPQVVDAVSQLVKMAHTELHNRTRD